MYVLIFPPCFLFPVSDEGVQPAGLLARLASIFTPAKRQRLADDTDGKCHGTLSTTTPAINSEENTLTPQTSFLPSPNILVREDLLLSSNKRGAELYYTPHTGLVYTSPNTIEMKDFTATSVGRRTRRRRSLRRREKREEVALSMRLQFKSPQSCSDFSGRGGEGEEVGMTKSDKEDANTEATQDQGGGEELGRVKSVSPSSLMSPI